MAYQYRAPDQATVNENTSNHRLYNPYQDPNIPTRTVYNLGENLAYYTGIGYLVGATAGATGGFTSGVKAIEPTDTLKQKINRILNGSGHSGRQVGNRCGIIELMYEGLESGMVAARDTDDVINSVSAGLGTGAIYKAAVGYAKKHRAKG
ncbi:mitochondrial import inner membrane translocase subunit tim23-1 [Phtheirospermum japonicum]|uniref:Mitochondrial import inner membrane translocase subunit tim23-1 n=1 Tax=Phtheirospermum japonicum TaxID=374723 RepID=A0A830D1U4_9LAMI|nr:mitochondrial import inner membrane translocase subunit tim23-1 [Phtheirospermum japonicum]